MTGKQLPDVLVDMLIKKEITHGEFAVYSFIRNIEKASEGICWASNAYIAKQIKLDKDWVKVIVNLGIKKGFLIVNKPYVHEGLEYRSLNTLWKAQGGEKNHSPLGDGNPTISYSSNKNTQSQVKPAQMKNKEKDETMLFPESKGKDTVSQKDLEFARILAKALKEKNLLGKHSIKKWAKEFNLLANKDSISSGRIQAALDFYIANIQKEYIPVILSGTSFREKFIKLELAMKRHRDKNPDVPVSARAKKNCSWIDYIGWPKGSAAKLPIAMQLSLDNLSEFVSRLKTHIENVGERKGPRSKRTAMNALDWVSAQGADNFLVMYFKLIHKQLKNWTAWNGDLLPWVLTPKARIFTELGREEIRKRSGDATNWDTLIEELGY